MKLVLREKFVNIFIFFILVFSVIILLWQRNNLFTKYQNNKISLEICKDQNNFILSEINLRERLIGKKISISDFEEINNIKGSSDIKSKILIYADAGVCKPCFYDIVNSLIQTSSQNKSDNISFIIVVASRNKNYAKSFTKKYINKISIIMDKKFIFENNYNIENKFTTCILLNEDNICSSLFLFRKGDEINNYKKIKTLLKISRIL